MTKYLTKTFSTWCAAVAVGMGLAGDLEATAYLGYELETVVSNVNGGDNLWELWAAHNNNVYITDTSAGDILMLPASGGAPSVVVSGVFPTGVCVDSLGNLYYTDERVSPGSVMKVPVGGGAATKIATSPSPYALCVDALNTIYFSDITNNNISKINSNGSTSVIASVQYPYEMCADNSGYLYVADCGNNQVLKIKIANGSSTKLTTANEPDGVCLDQSGNLFYTEFGAGTVQKIATSGGSSTLIANGLGNPVGITANYLGDLYVAAPSSSTIFKLLPTLTIDFTDGAVMAGPVTGGVKFVGGSSSNVCRFSGSATDDVQVTVGKVALGSAAPIASGRSMRLNGGDLIATAGFELPIVAMDQAGALDVNTNSTVGLKTLTGSGALTITTTNSGTGSVHLEDLSANSGGIVACSQPVVIDSTTKFPSNTCTIQGVATVNAAPGQASTHNLTFGEIDATTVNTAASSLTSATLYATKVKVGTKAWLHKVTAH